MFPLSFWLVTAICVFFYITIFPFVSVAKNYFMEDHDIDETNAATLASKF